MQMITRLLAFTGILVFSNTLNAQCPAGELSVTIDVITDAYGYEGYWELTPGTSNCGVSTIASGGNTVVGCTSGAQIQNPGGYASNETFSEGPWCLTEGSNYTIHYRDDWGDGGFVFQVKVGGFIIESFQGTGMGGDYTFTVANPPLYNLSLAGHRNTTPLMGFYQTIGDVELKVLLTNLGTETITSLEVYIQVDGGQLTSQPIGALSIANYETQIIPFPSLWNATEGEHTVDIGVSSINGMAIEASDNSHIIRAFEVGPPKQDIISSYSVAGSTFEVIANQTNEILSPTDLDFHPTLSNKQLWVINKGTENSGGATVIINNTGDGDQSSEMLQDGNAWHFMSLPTGIAFSDNGNFCTSPGVFDANHQGGNSAFTGPSLWSGSLDIYAQPSGGNGSHLDMLHESPFSQGVAWERDNVFWIFDGYSNDIVRYDFVIDHNPGNDDHSDAIIRRYSDVEVLKDPAGLAPSHMALDAEKEWLYIVDIGNQRVIRMNINTGSPSSTAPSYGPNEDVEEYVTITGYTWEPVVTSGLIKPCGIEIVGTRMLVSDYSTGIIHVYSISNMPATLEFSIQTEATGIMGLTTAPDGKIVFVDNGRQEVVSISPGVLGLNDQPETDFIIYPNPSTGALFLSSSTFTNAVGIHIFDVSGRLLESYSNTTIGQAIYPNLSAGVYLIRIVDSNGKPLKTTPWVKN
jgi:hypothetical protein